MSNGTFNVDVHGRVILVADIATLERILEALRVLHAKTRAFYADGVCVYELTPALGKSNRAICTCGNHDDAQRVAHALNTFLPPSRPEGTES